MLDAEARRIILDSVLLTLNDLLQRDRLTMSLLLTITVDATPPLVETGIPTTPRISGATGISTMSLLNHIFRDILGVEHPLGYKATEKGVIVAFGDATDWPV